MRRDRLAGPDDHPDSAAREDALRALGRRALTRSELRERLVRRVHDRATADRIVTAIDEAGLIDEAGCAEAVCRRVLAGGPAAASLLVGRITARGIDEPTARRAAERALAGTDPAAEAMRLARSRLPASGGAAASTWRRVAGALARRGFDEDTIGQVLDKLKAES